MITRSTYIRLSSCITVACCARARQISSNSIAAISSLRGRTPVVWQHLGAYSIEVSLHERRPSRPRVDLSGDGDEQQSSCYQQRELHLQAERTFFDSCAKMSGEYFEPTEIRRSICARIISYTARVRESA